jgi:enoyl-[acyl-carrier-protein] reductase (NADH)
VKGQEIQDLLKRIIFLKSENEFLRKKLEELQQSQTAAPVVNHDVSDKSQLQSIAASLTKVT